MDHQLGLPVLYTFRRCPYAMRARLAIVAAGLKVELRELVLRAKPAHMLEISPKGTVPVLWLQDGTVIDESLDVMRWAVGQNFPAGWLVMNTDQRQQCDEWIALLDGEFKRNLDRYKYPSRYAFTDGITHRDEAALLLHALNALLIPSGFLSGQHWGLADAAIAPFVRQFAKVDKAWFDAQPWPALQHWLGQFEQSSDYVQAMHKYKVWHPDHKPAQV